MFGNGIDGELESGEGGKGNQFTRNEAGYAPVTPDKLGRVDPSLMYKTWLESPFDDAVFGKFGWTSKSYEAWSGISCTDLLAMANAGGGGGGAVAAAQTQPCGRVDYLCDLNLPPQMMAEPVVNTGLSLQFTPLTPGKSTNLAEGKDVVETNKDSEKGLSEQSNLNGTPQPKQKRRKHRPKVVTEGTPKRARKPATPKPTTVNPDGSVTGKRKYVRRKVVEKSPTTPGVDETGGGVHPSPDQETKKTCKRKINFDECEKQADVAVDKASTETIGAVENDQKVDETGSPSPITPSKLELPPKSVKRQDTKAKCKINFLKETHDKVPSHLPGPNEPGCSTSVCNKLDEAHRSVDEIKHWNEHNAGMFRDNLESFLSLYTDYNCNMQSFAINNNKGKAPEMPKRGYNQARSQNSKHKKITMQDMVTFDGYHKQHTYIESNVAGFRVSNIKNKKQAMAASYYYNHLGYNRSIYGIDALIRQFEQLHINRDAGYHDKNALVVYQHGGSLVPYNMFNPIKKTKHRPKVDLDDETNRVWMLLLEDINSKGVDGNDEDKAKWWEEERRVFRGRADSFIARMHLVQGDRRFSPWKGSVLDSVVGVFLTQNVSDHLSSSAFMSLAARFPLKKNTRSEGVVNTDEFSKSCLVSVDLNEKSECEVAESFEKITHHAEVVEIASSQNSAELKDECEANVGGPGSLEILYVQESTRVYEKCVSEESGISVESASQTTGQLVNTISLQESATSHCCMVQQDLENKNIVEGAEESVQKVVDFHSQTIGQVVNTISSQGSANSHCCMVQQDLEKINLLTETCKATKEINIVEASEESVQKVVDFHSQTMDKVVNAISSQESANIHCCMLQQDLKTCKATKDKNIVEASEESVQKVVDFHSQTMGQVVNTISSQESANGHCCMVQQNLENKNLSTESFTVGEDEYVVKALEESMQKVVDFHSQTVCQVVNTISSQESATSHGCTVQQDHEKGEAKNVVKALEESTQKVVDFHSQTMGQVVNTISSQESATSHGCMVQQDLENKNLSTESFTVGEDENVVKASEESTQKVVDFHSQTVCQVVNTISSQESANGHCCTVQQDHEKINLSTKSFTVGEDKNVVKALEESMQKVVDLHSQTIGQVVNTISSQESATSHGCTVQQDHEKINLSTESFTVDKDKNIVEVSEESVQKVVDFNNNNNNKTNGADEGSSKVKKEKAGKSKSSFDWSKLFEDVVKQERERSPHATDSMDYEAIRSASINDVAEAIKERGMHFRLAERIKDMLDRLVRDHGSIDLEWLRDIPPDKAKEYLLSFAGLGLKSVECIRLLTLHHLAFPVDTNVGRIAVRLGWVPLQALPESLQLHLLELYPVQETIQKYLWPRLCKLDQKTLYELHYQMITFGKVFCTKTKPNCNACPMRGECRHFASAFASARLALPAPEGSIAGATDNKTGQNPIRMIDLPEQPKQPSDVENCNTVIEVPATQAAPIVEMPASPEPEQTQQEVFDIEDFNGDDDEEEIPMIKLNIEEFTQNLQTYMERHMELGECDLSKALVALTPEAASIPTPKLKNVSQLRTEHQVYELPDSHPLLEGLDKRETDDPCPYLLAVWTPGETADSIQPPEGQCCSQESGIMCNQETCFFCISTREANAQTIRGTLLIPCRTANRGSFPLNGTYFQVNEVFADHESSINPIDVPRAWLWNLPKRTVYFGTSVPSIFKGLTTEETQICFWRGFVCVRGYDRKERAPRPLRARLHFPASRLKQQPKPKNDPTRS